MNRGRIESVRIRGFRSLADIELSGLPQAAVLIGANGSGKSNFIRFFELLNWMLGSARLVEFIERQGGADDQLFGGNRRTPRLESEIVLRTAGGGVTIGSRLPMLITTASSLRRSVFASSAMVLRMVLRRRRSGMTLVMGSGKPRSSGKRKSGMPLILARSLLGGQRDRTT